MGGEASRMHVHLFRPESPYRREEIVTTGNNDIWEAEVVIVL